MFKDRMTLWSWHLLRDTALTREVTLMIGDLTTETSASSVCSALAVYAHSDGCRERWRCTVTVSEEAPLPPVEPHLSQTPDLNPITPAVCVCSPLTLASRPGDGSFCPHASLMKIHSGYWIVDKHPGLNSPLCPALPQREENAWHSGHFKIMVITVFKQVLLYKWFQILCVSKMRRLDWERWGSTGGRGTSSESNRAPPSLPATIWVCIHCQSRMHSEDRSLSGEISYH